NEYAELVQWRGTARGLQRLLELISMEPAEVRDSGGVFVEGELEPPPAHVKLSVRSSGWATDNDVLRIVRNELPAHVTFELHVGSRRIWPPEPDRGGGSDVPIL
ncbi:MAG TPA: hypothetical protein PLV68_08485, partial [Ilumatobacteraceae bacterium]|nr:hypothetical protein [Ilumatobacteraceae bacterium]